MSSGADADLIIVGMGPVGATAAALAGAAGLRTIVIDRDRQPYTLPRAIHFDAEIMRIFTSIGLRDDIMTITRPLGGSVYLGSDLRPIRTFRSPGPAHADAAAPSNLFYQPQLEAMLRANLSRFPTVDVRLGHDFRDVVQDDYGCRVTASVDGEEVALAASFVLACDGASSPVRKLLRVPLDDVGFAERWLVVDAFVRGPMRWPEAYDIPPEVREGRYSLMVCDPARPATLIPSVGEHRRWEYRLEPGESDALVSSDAWLRREIGAWIDPDDVEVIRSAVYNFRALVAHRWQVGRVFLAGDAAHQTPPFFGQGMCHGIRDAAQLIWKLRLVRDGIAAPALLETYQLEREPHVRAIVTASVEAGAAVCITDPTKARARDEEFRALEAARAIAPVAMTDVVPPIRRGIIDPATGGMRLPEFMVDRDDRRTRLDELLGGRFALLSTSPLDLDDQAAASWRKLGGETIVLDRVSDVDGRLAQWLDDQATDVLIVRPDRYVYGLSDRKGIAALVASLVDLLTTSSATQLVEIAV